MTFKKRLSSFCLHTDVFKYCSYLLYLLDWDLQLCSQCHCSYFLYYRIYERDFVGLWALHYSFILIGDIIIDVKEYGSNLAEGSLNALTGLSLFNVVFICVFPGWSMGACTFIWVVMAFWKTRFFVCLCQFLVAGLETYASFVL